MTKREAIILLTGFACSVKPQANHNLMEAITKAIDALEAQDRPMLCPRCGRIFAESEGREK